MKKKQLPEEKEAIRKKLLKDFDRELKKPKSERPNPMPKGKSDYPLGPANPT